MQDMVKDLETGRNKLGQFARGNTIQALSIPATTNNLKKIFLAEITPERMCRVTKRHLEICLDPDPKIALAAIELLYNRIMGKPKETLDIHAEAGQMRPDHLSDEQLGQIIAVIDQPVLEPQVST